MAIPDRDTALREMDAAMVDVGSCQDACDVATHQLQVAETAAEQARDAVWKANSVHLVKLKKYQAAVLGRDFTEDDVAGQLRQRSYGEVWGSHSPTSTDTQETP